MQTLQTNYFSFTLSNMKSTLLKKSAKSTSAKVVPQSSSKQVTPASCCRWPAVQRWERSWGLKFSLELFLYSWLSSIFVTFHTNNHKNQVFQVWKCAPFSTFKQYCTSPPLSMMTGFQPCLPTINPLDFQHGWTHHTNYLYFSMTRLLAAPWLWPAVTIRIFTAAPQQGITLSELNP